MRLMFRLKGTVILRVWWKVLILVAYTSLLFYFHNYIDDWHLKFTPTLIPVLGVVLGMLLVFRTNTAYDRYYEGRKLWSYMSHNIRTLTRCFWVMTRDKGESRRELVERISAVNLLIAFAYATKNYVRGKYSYDEEPLQSLISHIPKLKMIVSTNKKDLKRGISNTYRDYKAYDTVVPSIIPIEISHHVGAYIRSLQERDLVDSSTVSTMNTALTNLVAGVGDLERILRTPIPLAYAVHLVLPFPLIGLMNWFAIPAVALASFALLGMLSIGWEIENPFGYDSNDLPLDEFCHVIHTEALRITSRRRSTVDEWIFSKENHPCHPVSRLAAEDMSKLKDDEIHGILLRRLEVWVGQGDENGVEVDLMSPVPEEREEELGPMILPDSVVIDRGEEVPPPPAPVQPPDEENEE